jgi:3-methyladenine DNA glycosylase AlkD
MLREVGKRDAGALRAFLGAHCTRMPRTMLRYAIEKLPPAQRRAYLDGRV